MTEIWNINAPQGRIPCAIFTKLAVYTPFQDALGVKILLDLLKGLWRYGGFKLRGLVAPEFSAPPSGETMHQTLKRFRGARMCSRSSITMPSLVGLGFHPPPGWPKTLSFYRKHCAQRKPAGILVYSEADFEVFRPAGATRCTVGGLKTAKIGIRTSLKSANYFRFVSQTTGEAKRPHF